MRRVIFTQKQLDEVIGGDFQYLKDNTTGMGEKGDAEIVANPTLSDNEEHGKPITGDEFGSKIAPNRRFGYIGAGKVNITCSKTNKKKVVSESNQDLVNKKFKIPDEIYGHLKNNLQGIQDKSTKGYKRLNNLVNNRYITTSEMYRLKNFFDKNSEESAEYNLIGGNEMKTWIEKELGAATTMSRQSKEIKRDLGQNNAFIKSHEKTCGNNGAHTRKDVEITYE